MARTTNKLSDIAIKKTRPSESVVTLSDGGGLSILIHPTGKKSWVLAYRVNGGKQRKVTLGDYPDVSLKDARDRRSEIRGKVSQGADPAAERKVAQAAQKAVEAEAARRDGDSVAAVVDRFLTAHARKHTRESTARETERLFAREIVPVWGQRPLAEITRRDVRELVEGIAEGTVGKRKQEKRPAPIMANRLLAAFRKLCNWALARDIITASPCDGIEAPSPETSRDRVLTRAEIGAAWRAFEAAGWPFGHLAQMLLLTGARRDEVGQMRWAELDLEARTWTIPAARAKNGQAHEIPLSDAAMRILESLPHVHGPEGFVFTTNGKNPVSGHSRAKAAFDAAMATELGTLERWTLHDLRRTAASGMGALGVAPHVIEAVLNHRSGVIRGVARTYNRYAHGPEKRNALDAWAREVEAIVKGGDAGNVVTFKRPA